MFGERLKDLRKKKNLTQEELGKKFNVGKTTISNWEANITEPQHTILLDIANFFGVSIDYLLGNEISKQDEIELLKKCLVESGYDVPENMTISDLEKALKMMQIMKEDK